MKIGGYVLSTRYLIMVSVLVSSVLLLSLLSTGKTSDSSDFLFFNLGFVGLTFCPLVALYYLASRRFDLALPLPAFALSLLTLMSLALLFDLSDTTLVKDMLGIIHRRFQQPYWQWAGLSLAGLIFLPLLWRALRNTLRSRQYSDLLVCGSFLVFVLLLYLPFGFDSIGLWETWSYRAFLEGQFSWNINHELVTRFWVAVPHLLATIISPDSFIGFHLVHLLIFWAKMVLFYGIMRKLGLLRLHAFLVSIMFMIYPVNSALISLRSLPNQFSIMSLLAAGYLALDFRDNPSRLHLIGIWLGLVLNVVSNETAYAVILVAPLLWYLRERRAGWKYLNLTVIWYLFPLCKIAYLLLLSALNISFYNSHVFDVSAVTSGTGGGFFGDFFGRLVDVYHQTFVGGWQDAVTSLSDSSWLSWSLVNLLLVISVGWYLSRGHVQIGFPTHSQAWLALLGGLLFMIPSVGVLIWLDQYSGDLWRMYFYVPIAAAIVLFSVIILLTSPLRNTRFRTVIVIVICLVLILPATVRLLAQHQYYVTRANSKALMLMDLLELIPQINPDTVILLKTDMSQEQLDASVIYEFNYSNDLDNSMLSTLYGNGQPVHSSFCFSANRCSTFGGEETMFSAPEEFLHRTLVIQINEDLSVQLVDQPVDYFGLATDVSYDAQKLYDSAAEVPSRVYTMLSVASPAPLVAKEALD